MPVPITLPLPSSSDNLWTEVMHHFGLSQAALGRVLGLRPAMVHKVVTRQKSLPLPAAIAFARLVLALPSGAAATSAPIPTAALLLHGQACVATAARLAIELADAQGRAAWAERRLAALTQLAAPLLPTDTAPPAWLTQFESEARVALTQYGRAAQAQLALRRAGLLREAAAAAEVLSGSALADLCDEEEATTLSQFFNPLPTGPQLTFSVSRFTTKAQCQAYLDRKCPERMLLVAHLGSVQARLATWDQKEDPAADQSFAQGMVDIIAPALAATTNPRQKHKLERLFSTYRSRVLNLSGRLETHGVEQLIDTEQERDNTIGSLAVLDALLLAVTNQRDALAA